MYNLAKNQDKQNKLREELKKVPTDGNGKLMPSSFDKVPYLRACIKESFRKSPIILGNSRGAGRDIVIKGHQVPKGVSMKLPTIMSFEKPLKKITLITFLHRRLTLLWQIQWRNKKTHILKMPTNFFPNVGSVKKCQTLAQRKMHRIHSLICLSDSVRDRKLMISNFLHFFSKTKFNLD